jgi:hypothetical protein
MINTLHFDIYYPDEISDLALYAAKAAEESYVYLANCFKHEISFVIPIIIHVGKKNEFSLSFGKIDLCFHGSYRLFRKEMTHKMVYSFQYDIMYNSKPGWDMLPCIGFPGVPYFVSEGMAEYLSAGYDEEADFKAFKILNSDNSGLKIDIKKLDYLDRLSAGIIGQSFFYFLEKSFGGNVMGELLLNVKDNDNIYDGISLSTGKTIEELNVMWIDFFKQNNRSGYGNNTDKNKSSLLEQLNNLGNSSNNIKLIIEKNKFSNRISLYDTAAKKNIAEIKVPFNEVKYADISGNGKLLVFVGLSYSSSDVYLYNMQSEVLIRLTNDHFEKVSPRISTDNSNVVFVSNENDQKDFSSNIFRLIRFDLKTNTKTIISDTGKEMLNFQYKNIRYPESYFDIKDADMSSYSNDLDFNFNTSGGGTAWNKSFTGFINITACDYLKTHLLEIDTEYIRFKGNNNDNDLSYTFNYKFSKYFIGMGIGSFYKASPLESGFNSGYLDGTGNGLVFYANNISSNNLGANGYLIFPFIDKSYLRLNYCSGIYENADSSDNYYRKNIYTKDLSLLLNYDSLVYNKAWPVDGARGVISVSEGLDIGEREQSLTVIGFNLIKILHYNNWFVFSLKGSGGKIYGRDNKYFNYYIGGFNSVRGHALFAYSGRNAFASTTEIKFIILDRLTLRWPAEIKFNDISLAIFADFGSAWDSNYNLMDSGTGKFDELKSGAGFGLRFLFQDHIIFKVDAAWPYFYKSFGKREIISGFEFRY